MLTLFLAALLLHAPTEVVVFDGSLQRVVGYGKQQGEQLKVEVLEDYSGPVVAMLLRDQVTSAPGVMVGGQLTITTPNGTSTLAQYLDALGVDLKLTVVKTPKLDVQNKNQPADASSGNKPDNSAGKNGQGSTDKNKDGQSNGNGNAGGSSNGNGSSNGSGNGAGNGKDKNK